MGWFDNNDEVQRRNDNYDPNYVPQEHEASMFHEVLAGGAAFYAARKYEEHVAENGPPPSHALAKELMAGFAGAFVDREVETKGMDYVDKEKAKREAQRHINDIPQDQFESYHAESGRESNW